MTTPAPPTPAPQTLAPVARSTLLRRLLREPLAVASVVVLAAMAVLSAAAPLLTTADPAVSSLADVLAAPSAAHPLGADGVGRDTLARLLYGGRTSLLGGLLAVLVAVAVGLPSGLMAGYFRGRFDAVASWLANLIIAVPGIILLLVVIAAFGQNTYLAMAVFGLLLAPGVFRLIRASVTAVREELYVDAAKVSGLSSARIIGRHILPVVIGPTIIQAAQMFGIAIVIQSGLEFLGLGSPSQPSWGSMLNDAFANIYLAPSLLLWPVVAIVLTVAALGLLGNALRDAYTDKGARKRVRRARGAPAAALDPGPPAPDDALLVIDRLHVSYPTPDGEKEVVSGISLYVRRGEVLGLVGESGSGKSQTAFSILGLLPGDASVAATTMSFDGAPLDAAAQARLRGSKIAYIPQEPMSNLDPAFRIGSQLIEPLRTNLHLSKADAHARSVALLERVGIVDAERVMTLYPHEISGGMAQRVLIAGAVSCDPVLLIADEPTTALDVTVQAEVLDLLRSLQSERQLAVIMVTHDFGVVADVCDRVAVMQHGKIVETAPAAQLFAGPEHPYTRMLLDSTLEDAPLRPPLVDAARSTSGAQA